MRRLDRLTFRVPDANACYSFYETMLGMSVVPTACSTAPDCDGLVVLGYPSNPKGLKLTFQEPAANTDTAASACTTRQPTSKDAYWKIGITVKHLDHAVAYLQRQGVSVSQPAQFLDLGYFCHLRDPAGMTIELLQQTFQRDEANDDAISGATEGGHPIGAQTTLEHITLQSTNLPKLQQWCEEEMKLLLLSIQPVPAYGFTLYFYGWSTDVYIPCPTCPI